jgi:hypothetical protein
VSLLAANEQAQLLAGLGGKPLDSIPLDSTKCSVAWATSATDLLSRRRNLASVKDLEHTPLNPIKHCTSALPSNATLVCATVHRPAPGR